MTEEESATLLTPPAEEPETAPDPASTVMFHAGSLPWNAAGAPPDAAPAAAVPVVMPDPEPVFLPESVEAAEVVEEPAVFEEVLEEDLDFGAAAFEPDIPSAPRGRGRDRHVLAELRDAAPRPARRLRRHRRLRAGSARRDDHWPEDRVPSSRSRRTSLSLNRRSRLSPSRCTSPSRCGPSRCETGVRARARAGVRRPAPRAARYQFAPSPEPVEPVYEPVYEPAPVLEPVAVAPPPVVSARLESFAEVAAAVSEPPPPSLPMSESAAMSVPLEMVEKIAQRVVAQISRRPCGRSPGRSFPTSPRRCSSRRSSASRPSCRRSEASRRFAADRLAAAAAVVVSASGSGRRRAHGIHPARGG